MSDKIFVDTNILVYSVSPTSAKQKSANELLLQESVVVSPQVISEFVSVTLRKKILESEKVIAYAKGFLQTLHIQ